MSWNQEQRNMAAADCTERIAKRMREGFPVAAMLIMWVERIRINEHGPAHLVHLDYAFLLAAMNVETADVDAAVAAIEAGKHPVDSLPGKLERVASGDACKTYDDYASGQVSFAGEVLQWIGVKS